MEEGTKRTLGRAERIRAAVRMLRPGNMAIAGAGTALGALLAVSSARTGIPGGGGAPRPEASALLLQTASGCAAMALLVAAGNVHNDILDLPADRLNRPDRALPSGALSVRAAAFLAASLCLCALASALAAGGAHAALAVALALLLCAYNALLKGLPRLGNAAVSLLSATPLLWVCWPSPSRAQCGAALLGFALTFARELAKDLEDVEGDRAAGRSTLPLARGVPAAVRALRFRAALACALALGAPWICGWETAAQRTAWYAALAPLFLPPLLKTVSAMRKSDWGKAERSLKASMVGGMSAILAAALVPFFA